MRQRRQGNEAPSRIARMRASLAALRQASPTPSTDIPQELLDALSNHAATVKAIQPDTPLSPYLVAMQRRAEVARLSRAGMKAKEVATAVGISVARVRQLRAELGLAKPRQASPDRTQGKQTAARSPTEPGD